MNARSEKRSNAQAYHGWRCSWPRSATAAQAADLVLYGAGSLREAMTQIATSFGQAHGLDRYDAIRSVRPDARAYRKRRPCRCVHLGRCRPCPQTGRGRQRQRDGGVCPQHRLSAVTGRIWRDHRVACWTRCLPLACTSEFRPPKSIRSAITRCVCSNWQSDIAARQQRSLAGPRGGDRCAARCPAAEIRRCGCRCDPGSTASMPLSSIALAGTVMRILLPDATLVTFPPRCRSGRNTRLAVLKNARPGATLLALTILSPDGQQMLANCGFHPVTLPSQ